MTKKGWLDADREGLAKLIHDRSDVVRELVANSLDTNAKRIAVTLEAIKGRRGVTYVIVEDDDPKGFEDLAHAWTLFAESSRRSDPSKRGRFCMGEKLVLSLCEWAEIETVSGSVRFDDKGRHRGKRRREQGTTFKAVMKLSQEDARKAREVVRSVIVPASVVLTLDGERVPSREFRRTFHASLPTEFSDSTGALHHTKRKTTVTLYTPQPGEKPTLYELGIPVVELDQGERWHVNVGQKVQVTMDRTNVTTVFMREMRLALLNGAHDMLETEADAKATWTREALGNSRSDVAAVKTLAKLRHGDGAVAADPSDREAEKRATSKDVPVVHGGSATGSEWASFKRAGVLLPAGKVYPTPKPYSTDPDAPAVTVIPESEWTFDQRAVVVYIRRLAPRLLEGDGVEVRLVDTTNPFTAAYRDGELDLNCRVLADKWAPMALADRNAIDWLNELIIHEFGHHYSSDHLSESYHDALCKIGARFLRLWMDGRAPEVCMGNAMAAVRIEAGEPVFSTKGERT